MAKPSSRLPVITRGLTNMPPVEFRPGFRFSLLDGVLLVSAGVGAVALSRVSIEFALLAVAAVLHFFLFCNVFRVSRPLELSWSAFFLACVGIRALAGVPWSVLGAAVLGATVLVVWRQAIAKSYHGILWRWLNPELPAWWARQAGAVGRAGEVHEQPNTRRAPDGQETTRDWPFDQPRDAASIAARTIVSGGAPILHVTHDADDHRWQFLGLEDARENDACVVGLSEIVAMDPSVLELADLPPGWHAWRSSNTSPWQRGPRG